MKPGRYSQALSQPMDVASTVLAAASVKHPGTQYKDRTVYPLQGRSLFSVINNQADQIYSSDEQIVIELLGNGAILSDNWKLMRMRRGAGGSNEWELYDLAKDPQEKTDLSSRYPDVYEDLLSRYQDYAVKYNIVPVDDDWVPRPGAE
jgi:arylsulfatase A-like enzyme